MVTLARLTFKWGLLSGAEQGLSTCHLLDASAPVSSLISAVNAADSTLWTAVRSTYTTGTTLAEVVVQTIDVTTGAVLTTASLGTVSPNTGSSSNQPLPPQISSVLTIRTAASGRRNRGRMYLPNPQGALVNTDGTIPTATRNALVDAWGAFFDSVNSSSGYQLGVYSRANAAWEAAVSVDMGNVYDTQRRRRSSLKEARYSHTLT